MNFYSKILYSKDLEFTYHSKIKKKKITKEQKSYVSYEAYNLSRKSKN